jgi:hypothetical protein
MLSFAYRHPLKAAAFALAYFSLFSLQHPLMAQAQAIAPATASAAPPAGAAPTGPPAKTMAAAVSPPGHAARASLGPAVFPTKVSAKYTSQAAGRARMHTCRDQYEANKAASANGGLKWIQKGGGYYSQCLKQLKA